MSDTPEQSPKEKRGLAARLFKPLGLLLFLLSMVGGWFAWDYKLFADTPLPLNQPLLLEVKPGVTVTGLARELRGHGLLERPRYFTLLARLTDRGRRIKAGEYRLEPGLTPDGLLALLVAGRSVEYSITLVEGWSFRQMVAAIHADELLTHTLLELDEAEIMNRLGRPGEHPEGRFFPDTYRFPRGETDLNLLKRAYRRTEKVLAEEWEKREEGLPLKTPYEALILASIIEKETGQAAERPEIAGVFTRRLRKGMLLQTDPTVIYGMGESFDGNIRRKDLRTDTPYNTYTRKGLPPTPIAMAGREAIHAALHPADGKSLYFVAKGDGSGEHYFSATLKEHNRAVRKYQLKR